MKRLRVVFHNFCDWLLTPRSSRWPSVRGAYLERHPACEACGGTQNLEVHHVKPFHDFPMRELDMTNLMTLCMAPDKECHLRVGHLGNWKKFNANARADAAQILAATPTKNHAKAHPGQ